MALERPRVRSAVSGKEVRLRTLEEFKDPKSFESKVFAEGLKKVFQRDYEKGLSTIAGSFGFKKSSISRRWLKVTAKKLDELQAGSFADLDIRTVFIDDKCFHKQGVIVALGIAASGRKYVLGIYQSSSENSQACRNLLNDLEKRGHPESGLIFVVDAGSGLNKALEQKLRRSR